VQVVQNRLSGELAKNHEIAAQCGTTLEYIDCYIQKRDVSKMLSSIVESGERASRIINNMLSFSRKSISRYTPCNIVELLDKTVDLVANDYDLKKRFDFRKVEIVRVYDNNVKDVRCDPTTIQQVFFNIVKNAAQAMLATVDKNTNVKELSDPPRIILRVFEADGHVKIAVEDNGIGMDEETSNRIFEPFFTTKNIGVGTGLGLSVSYFIVKENHKGSINVTSKPGEGSTFTVSLPL
jgi:signal transduction histidine kinase